MPEHDTTYEAAYQAAHIMRDKTLKPLEREKRVNEKIYQVEDQRGSFIDFHECLSLAIAFITQEQKGI